MNDKKINLTILASSTQAPQDITGNFVEKIISNVLIILVVTRLVSGVDTVIVDMKIGQTRHAVISNKYTDRVGAQTD